MPTLTDEQFAALMDRIAKLERGQVAATLPTLDDYDAVSMDQLFEPGAFGRRHRYDVVRPDGTVAEPTADDWPALYEANPFPDVPLQTKRRELGAIMRFKGWPVKPAWFDRVLSADVHNRGIDRRVAELQQQIERLRALRA